MRDLKEYTIPFIGLKLGEHHFDYIVTNKFFEHFEYDEFIDTDIKLDVLLNKKTTLLEFTLDYKGKVGVHCDVTNEPFQQPIEGHYHFIVKFGEDFNNDNEDLLVIPHGSYEVNIQQFVYESIILTLPTRRIHPGIEDGTLESDILDKLEELSLKAQNDDDTASHEGNDPRWDSLKKLLNDK